MAADDAQKFVDRVASDSAFRAKLGDALQPFLQAARDNGYNFNALELQEAIRKKYGAKPLPDNSACVAGIADD
jgi:predicted ribosomally synthesized peptide with nif11-like leader